MRCNCHFCKLHRRMNRTMHSGSHQQKNALILELMDLWCHTDADLNYEHAVADGSWPTAVEVLERRLENAKAKQEMAA